MSSGKGPGLQSRARRWWLRSLREGKELGEERADLRGLVASALLSLSLCSDG